MVSHTFKYCLLHNGCDALEADSNDVREVLEKQLEFVSSSLEEADLIVYLACTFSQEKESNYTREVMKICGLSDNRPVIVSGCYLEESLVMPNLFYCPRKEIGKVVSDLFDVQIYDSNDHVYSFIPSNGIITISEGCLGRCTYCSIRLVRGSLRSRTIGHIIRDIGELSGRFSVLKLISQDIGAYGQDLGLSIWHLLKKIFEGFPEIDIELGPIGPEWLISSKDEDMALLSQKNISGNIHIPLQSASNKVLKRMGRKYSYEEFENLLDRLDRMGIKNISSDLLAGFPGESEQDHFRNIDFLRSHKLAFAQFFMYESRKGTIAANMPQISREVKMRRTIDLITEYMLLTANDRKTDISSLIMKNEEFFFNTNISFIKGDKDDCGTAIEPCS